MSGQKGEGVDGQAHPAPVSGTGKKSEAPITAQTGGPVEDSPASVVLSFSDLQQCLL